jgi:hypothetical protein
MTWTWLFVWDVFWLVFALLWVSLEGKLGGDPPQGGPGRNNPNKLERREVKPPRNRPVRAPRGLRPVRALRVHRR